MFSGEVNPAVFGAQFRGVDLAIALAPRDLDHRIVAATRAERRVGYTYETRYLARLILRTMLTKVVLSQADPMTAERRPDRPIAHEVDQVLAVVAAAGAQALARDLVLPVTDEDRAAVAHLPSRPVVVQLGQRWTGHGSSTASCLQLFRDLRALGRPLIATYGEDAQTLGADVAQAAVADVVLGSLPFHVWAAVFERAACVVTIDTGATHVASAVRVPTVVLFEHKWFRLASQEWSPYRVPNAILRKPPDEFEGSLRASRAEIVAAVASLLV
jgi:ADP-heptose:LPS heptosyltransferase